MRLLAPDTEVLVITSEAPLLRGSEQVRRSLAASQGSEHLLLRDGPPRRFRGRTAGVAARGGIPLPLASERRSEETVGETREGHVPHGCGILIVELAGLEPATSWVRYGIRSCVRGEVFSSREGNPGSRFALRGAPIAVDYPGLRSIWAPEALRCPITSVERGSTGVTAAFMRPRHCARWRSLWNSPCATDADRGASRVPMTDFLVKREDLRECRIAESEVADLAPGQALLRVDSFGLTANNVTYAVFGETMSYWDFFPAGEGWGRVPMWGFAEVERRRPKASSPARGCMGTCPPPRTSS